MKIKSRTELVVALTGICLLLSTLLVNEWVLATFTTDGRIDSAAQLLLIRTFDGGALLLGAALIFFRRSPLVPRILVSFLIFLGMFVAIDYGLYLLSPRLPAPIVAGMSPQAQVRYYHANAASQPWIYDENIRYARPNIDLVLFDIPIKADSLGYRNPPGYFEAQQPIDVVLLGDSFIWGTEEKTIADFMRAADPETAVYSLGMAGSGMPQWRYHFRRFTAALPPAAAPPPVVVLNFYSGNDLTDTNVFLTLQAAKGSVDSADYFAYINFQFLLPSATRRVLLPKLPETFFLTNYMVNARRAGNSSVTVGSSTTNPHCLHHREPMAEQFTAVALAQISQTVGEIRAVNPQAEIILSYIPTSSGIYGDQMDECPAYAADVGRQAAASHILADHAATLDIHYLDVTPTMRAAAETAVVWSQIDHFSPRGNDLYAQFLLENIKTILSDKVVTK